MCALVLKRGRGRPRLNESREYNDSDLHLINEFRKRPALFDKNHPLYRDKENTDKLWHEMAQLLNTPVSMIRERTVQLRNRYNIERRRMDSVTDDQSTKWSLFEHLTFLSDHIKPRRALLPSRPESPNLPRASKRTKVLANVTESESEDDEQNSSVYAQPQPINYNYNNHNHYEKSPNAHSTLNGFNYTNDDQLNIPPPNSTKKEIYRAFGNFVSSSLIGMKEKDALRLLEKFTKELVQNMNSPNGDPC